MLIKDTKDLKVGDEIIMAAGSAFYYHEVVGLPEGRRKTVKLSEYRKITQSTGYVGRITTHRTKQYEEDISKHNSHQYLYPFNDNGRPYGFIWLVKRKNHG